MPRYKLVVLSSPLEGREADYNDWYQNIHMRQVMAIPGFESGQRYRRSAALTQDEFFPYLAIYEIETDDIAGALAELRRRAGNGQVTTSDALAPKVYAVAYEALGSAVTAE